ncbi:LPXTG cell wall anchor domain-containing protein [Lapidilactobacillus bayanensis]|uniref:LPXTG cell wall anchor domain-containing protein n=1 Tax=Lapidilactobacillus bayanensis TaxID=2485998 RepID=UPI000F76D8F2|nr:LPXTG cell wall anchor domain-containing protein [Lapidilactobacillus bayanensis]
MRKQIWLLMVIGLMLAIVAGGKQTVQAAAATNRGAITFILSGSSIDDHGPGEELPGTGIIVTPVTDNKGAEPYTKVPSNLELLGRLPQTGDSVNYFLTIIGIELLMIALILMKRGRDEQLTLNQS